MHADAEGFDAGFRPLRPESRRRRIAAFTVGPLAWLVAVDIATVLVYRINEILVGVVVVVALLLVLVTVVALLTVRLVEAESPLDPITVIVYTPAATLATTNEPDRVPPEIVQL